MPATNCKASLEQVDNIAYNVRHFRLKLEEPKILDFIPGQFVIVNVPKDGKVIKRAYSIASPPHEAGVLEFCIGHIEEGAASTYFWQLKAGDKISLTGPHGRFTLMEPINYDPVFMATGTGVAPFRSMIKHLFHQQFSRDVWLLLGCRYEHSILYDSEFRTLAKVRRNFHYMPTVSRPKEWHGETGHIQETFKRHITDTSNKQIYICGAVSSAKAIYTDLQTMGVPKERLIYEEW